MVSFLPIFMEFMAHASRGIYIRSTHFRSCYGLSFSDSQKIKIINCLDSQITPPIFLPNEASLSKARFRTHLVSVLKSYSLSPSQYTGHSFRIGATTTAAERSISTAAIKILGRWSSSAFESYIRPD